MPILAIRFLNSLEISSNTRLNIAISSKYIGFEERYLGEAMVNKMAAVQYCLEVTSRNLAYWTLFQNCQSFAKEILVCLTGDKDKLQTPLDAKGATTILASIVSVAVIGSKAISAYQRKENNDD